jgi:hypothetical protein
MSPKPQGGGPPLAGGPRLLIQYIRSYPHIGGCSSIRNLRTRRALVTGTHLSHGELAGCRTKLHNAEFRDLHVFTPSDIRVIK